MGRLCWQISLRFLKPGEFMAPTSIHEIAAAGHNWISMQRWAC